VHQSFNYTFRPPNGPHPRTHCPYSHLRQGAQWRKSLARAIQAEARLFIFSGLSVCLLRARAFFLRFFLICRCLFQCLLFARLFVASRNQGVSSTHIDTQHLTATAHRGGSVRPFPADTLSPYKILPTIHPFVHSHTSPALPGFTPFDGARMKGARKKKVRG